jgi:hypothetical protein
MRPTYFPPGRQEADRNFATAVAAVVSEALDNTSAENPWVVWMENVDDPWDQRCLSGQDLHGT